MAGRDFTLFSISTQTSLRHEGIEKRRDQRGYSVEATCTGEGNGGGGCGAILLVEQPDLYRTASHCRDEVTVYVTFQCCSCGVETDLSSKDSPPRSFVKELPSKKEWIGK